MTLEQQRRMLLRHGFVFLFLGPILGIAVIVLPHPQHWRATHVTALLTCFVLATIGLVWRELRLSDRQRRTALVTGFTAAYLGLAASILGAVMDLPGPASQPGVPMPMPQGAVFLALLAVVIATTVTSFGLVLYGLRGEAV
jgi:hypothetical protein